MCGKLNNKCKIDLEVLFPLLGLGRQSQTHWTVDPESLSTDQIVNFYATVKYYVCYLLYAISQ